MSTGKASSFAPGPTKSPISLKHPHVVQFYQEDRALIEELTRLIGTALITRDAAIVVATEAHRYALVHELNGRDLNIDRAQAEGRFISLDAAETLSRIMIGETPDPQRFSELMGDTIAKARAASRASQPSIVIFGEMVALLWAEGKYDAAMRLEELWNNLADKHSFSLRCAYPINGFRKDEHRELFMRICAEHSSVLPPGPPGLFLSDDESLRAIAQLQQKVKALEKETALGDSERRFRLLVEAVQDYAIFLLDTEGRIISWNLGAERMKGYKASEILGRHFSCFYPKEDAAKPARELEIAIREGRVEDEGWRLRKDGSRFWANVVITALKDGAGNLTGFAKVTRDVTERRQAVKSLEEHAALLRLAHDAIIVRDFDGKIHSWNRGAEELYGWRSQDVVGKTTHTLLRTQFPNSLESINRLLFQLGRWDGELRHTRNDGTEIVVASRWALRADTEGGPALVLEINRDITRAKHAEEKLSASERSLRQLSRHLLRTQDEERRRIGRDLHDSLGQLLAVLKMKLDSLASAAGRKQLNDANGAGELAECARIVDESVKEVRTISYLLYPPMLEELGLKSAIGWYLEGFSSRSGVKTLLKVSPDFGRLDAEVELALFRVLQESLTNVHRHSGSQTASVRLSVNANTAILEISDQGKGIQLRNLDDAGQYLAGSHGVGLRGMTERMRQVGGQLELSSSNSGTTVTATVSIPQTDLPEKTS
jgi:PAS domain S-box-containing protein